MICSCLVILFKIVDFPERTPLIGYYDEANPEVAQFVQGLPDGPVPFHYPASDYLQEL